MTEPRGLDSKGKEEHALPVAASLLSSSPRHRKMARASIVLAVVGAFMLAMDGVFRPPKSTTMTMVTIQEYDEQEASRDFSREIASGMAERGGQDEASLRSSRTERKQAESQTRNLDSTEENDEIAVSDGDADAYTAWTVLSSKLSSDEKSEDWLIMEEDAIAASVDRATTPIFRCTSQDLPRTRDSPKLIFVHVFKTAGSSMRDLLADYARLCQAGYAVITGCSNVNVDSIGPESKSWTSDTQGPCPIKKFASREDGELQIFGKDGDQLADNRFIMENVDIIAGHLPLGTGAVFGDDVYPIPAAPVGAANVETETRARTRYVAFFRDAVEKFVSATSFLMTQKGDQVTENQLMARVKETVTKHFVKRQEYKLNYANYLITPEQQSQLAVKSDRVNRKDIAITPRAVAVQVMFNLVEWDVLVGHTSYMSESLELVQYVLDPRSITKEIFLEYGREDRGNPKFRDNEDDSSDGDYDEDEEEKTEKKKNVSVLSTGEVASKIAKADPDFFALLKEYVKYEQQIADFALALHKKQHEVVKAKRREDWLARQNRREALATYRASKAAASRHD